MISRVLIAGGGIGGLTLALMLQARGIEARVFEAAPAVRPLGVGINVLPHAIRELSTLGLLPALDAIGIRTRQLTYANQLGQPIWSEPRGLHAGAGAPQFSLHRGRLQMMLWDAAVERLATPPGTGRRLLDWTQDDGGVVVRLQRADGTSEQVDGDVLVAADGIHSTVRALLHPADGGIRWNGISMWRGATEWPAHDGGDNMMVAGDAVAKLVLYPIGMGDAPGTRLTNWVSTPGSPRLGPRLPAGRAGRGRAATTISVTWRSGSGCHGLIPRRSSERRPRSSSIRCATAIRCLGGHEAG